MEMVEVAVRFARTAFVIAMTFMILALIALFLLGVNEGEEVVGAIVLAVNALVMIAAGAVLIWADRKEAKMKKANLSGEKTRTLDHWLDSQEEEQS